MHWSDIPWKPSSRTLRQFAAIWIVFFGLLAVWHGFWHERVMVAAVLGVLASTVGPIGLVRPQWIRPVFVAWIVLAFPIGWAVSRVLLALMFYGLFTPTALVFRLMGRDALRLRRADGETATYWTPRPAPAGIRSYFQQF